MAGFLREKFSGMKIDVIITTSPGALDDLIDLTELSMARGEPTSVLTPRERD
jgi:hypothetical protein